MNNKERSDVSTGEGDSRYGKSSDRRTVEKVFRDEGGNVGGGITLTVMIEGGRVVRLRARDAKGRPYQVGFRALFADEAGATLLDHHSHGGHHGGDDDDNDDGDECVRCSTDGLVCWTAKCKK